MKLKFSFRLIVTLASIFGAIILGLTRIYDPELVEVMRLKYFDQLQKKFPRSTDGQTYSVIVDIDEKSLREIGQWPWPRSILADLVNKTYLSASLGFDIVFAEFDRTGSNELKKQYKKNHQTSPRDSPDDFKKSPLTRSPRPSRSSPGGGAWFFIGFYKVFL